MTKDRPIIVQGRGNFLRLADGRDILDASGGAGVACLGHNAHEIIDAMSTQASKISYAAWGFFENKSKLELARWIYDKSQEQFPKVFVNCSGSEAMEGAMKLAREYFLWRDQPRRINYIAREDSYHGTTIGALSLGGHLSRRGPYEPLLVPGVHRISACNPYRQQLPDEGDAQYVQRKVEELEAMFIHLGGDTVIAFVAEPIVGAAAGCIPAACGYFKAMKAVCDRHGALLILDEVMCGMGRTGTLHAWEQEGIVPDIQAVGKGLAGGYQPVSAILVGQKVAQLMDELGVTFNHGHTYQDHPVACAAALKVQQIIERDGLLENVRLQGQYLERLLRARLRDHPHVGNIRGRGLFWAIEFVRDRETREPFDPEVQVAHRVHTVAMAQPLDISLYPGQGCAGDGKGDHIMIMPAYNMDRNLINTIVDKTVEAINRAFESLREEN